MKPETESRLKAVQARIDEAGIKDIKPFWNRESIAENGMVQDDLANYFCDVVESILDGNYTEIDMLDGELGEFTPKEI